jgi:MoxR-like ATPase
MTTTLQDKFLAVEADMQDVVLDREAEIHSAILAIISGSHMFLLGSPGIAKSMLVDELVARVDAKLFKWTLSKFSLPEELFGGPDLNKMKNEGIYRRITDNKLPQAEIAFVDEIFKANPSILNALLKIINEKEFENPGDDPHVPLISLFSASNEMPQTAELEALVDRLQIKHIVKPITDPDLFVKMLALEPREPLAFITIEDIHEAQRQVSEVTVGDNIHSTLLDLSNQLRAANVVVTDRRFRQSISVIKAQAWLSGRNVAEINDCMPLIYMMWRDPEQFETVRQIVIDLADPLEHEVMQLRDQLEKVWSEFRRVMDDENNDHVRGKQAIASYGYFKEARDEWRALANQTKESDRQPSKSLTDLHKRLKEVGPKILKEGMGIDDDDSTLDLAVMDRTEGL